MSSLRPWLPPLLICVAALAVALVLHAPLLASADSIPGEPGSDALRGLWTLWLVGERWWSWPLGFAEAGFPNGVTLLPFPALSLSAVALPTRLLGPVPALRLLVLGHSVLAVLGGAFLVRSLKGSWGMALLAGVLIASTPLMGGALRDGTLEVLSIGWVPLILGASARAARGERGWGPIAGALFVISCLESAYYASFSALGVLATLSLIRSKSGIRELLLAAAVVLAGVATLAGLMWPVIASMADRMDSTGDGSDLQAMNAITWEQLQLLSRSPGARGWRVSDIWAPPWPHWILLGVGALAALRRDAWLSVLALLAMGLALHHSALHFWAEGPIGAVVRFPRRYIALVVVAGAAGLAGLGPLLRRWWWLDAGLGVLVGGWVLNWGAAAGGLQAVYPLMDLQPPAFVQDLAADPESATVLMLPTQVPASPQQAGDTRTSTQEVFGGLEPVWTGAERVAFPTLADKGSFQAPGLLTLVPKPGPDSKLAKHLSDLSFPHFGQQVPGDAIAPSAAYNSELAWLTGLGLKYVVVDLSVYEEAELKHLDGVLRPYSVDVRDFAEGGGQRIYQLYDQRPPPADPPAAGSAGQPSALRFAGEVLGGRSLHTDVHVLAITASGTHKCMVHPDSGSFECNTTEEVVDAQLWANGAQVPVTRSGDYSSVKLQVRR
ncbi:MAG: hypothetical protein VX899_11775 [Myxococcota bacterium]|nr:hypothetical protein [Myxococcota bacterium]